MNIFRRSTIIEPSTSKNPDDFSDYTSVVASENNPQRLKDYIGRLYKAFKDKSRSLRNAYEKIDQLNDELVQEKTRYSDIEDENKSLRDQMHVLASQLAKQEEEFKEWQERLVDSAIEEREYLESEHNEECITLEDRILDLQEELQSANDQVNQLTLRIREMSTNASDPRATRRSSMDSRLSDTNSVVTAVKYYDEEKRHLANQLYEVTQRKMTLETELDLLKEEQEDLKNTCSELKEENNSLREELAALRQQLGRRAFMKSLEDVSLDD